MFLSASPKKMENKSEGYVCHMVCLRISFIRESDEKTPCPPPRILIVYGRNGAFPSSGLYLRQSQLFTIGFGVDLPLSKPSIPCPDRNISRFLEMYWIYTSIVMVCARLHFDINVFIIVIR